MTSVETKPGPHPTLTPWYLATLAMVLLPILALAIVFACIAHRAQPTHSRAVIESHK